MRTLFISRWFPYPPDNGAKIRISNLLKHLASRHEVNLISFTSEAVSQEHLEAAHQYCQHVACVHYRPFEPRRLGAIAGFFSTKPRSVVDTFSIEMQRLVEQAAHEFLPDVVIASEIDMAPYATALPNVPRILEELELTVLYENYIKQQHPLKRLRKGLMWWKSSRYVAALLQAFDGCTVVSEQEREQVLRVLPSYSPIRVVPNGINPGAYTASYGGPEVDTLVYSGALTYSANLDAIDFFLKQVLPLIRAKRPSVKLLITGGLEGVPVDRLAADDGVVFTGYLDNVRPTIARSWASIVPLRIGGGTRFKILESLALGTPVVATSKGAEGLNLVPGHDILIADEPADLADAVLRLLQDLSLRETLGCNGRRAIAAKYDWQTIGQGFCEFVEEIVGRGRKTR